MPRKHSSPTRRSAQAPHIERTEDYFQDVALTGEGKVKRCKLLILGNGGAGKTCLSLALVPGKDPMEARTLGSTHGVQFWNWRPFHADVGGAMEPIDLQLWDFGGQEIYHNTHRLFMSKSVAPRQRWRGRSHPGYGRADLLGNRPDHGPGLDRTHADRPAFAKEHNQINTNGFREALYGEIQKAIDTDSAERYVKLSEAIDSRGFRLTDDRIKRTLSFLTHSGWVYWNERLFQERVIVGQKWALDGIYTLLDRHENSSVYRKLLADDGRFTLSQLRERGAGARQDIQRQNRNCCCL